MWAFWEGCESWYLLYFVQMWLFQVFQPNQSFLRREWKLFIFFGFQVIRYQQFCTYFNQRKFDWWDGKYFVPIICVVHTFLSHCGGCQRAWMSFKTTLSWEWAQTLDYVQTKQKWKKRMFLKVEQFFQNPAGPVHVHHQKLEGENQGALLQRGVLAISFVVVHYKKMVANYWEGTFLTDVVEVEEEIFSTLFNKFLIFCSVNVVKIIYPILHSSVTTEKLRQNSLCCSPLSRK